MHQSDIDRVLSTVREWDDEEFRLAFGFDRTPDDAETPRPRSGCGCGYDLIWVDGHWEHDAAPALWGDDHDANPDCDEPEDLQARCYWDAEDGLACGERASRLENGYLFREYGMDEWRQAADCGQHGDTVLVTDSEGVESSFDIDEVIEIIRRQSKDQGD